MNKYKTKIALLTLFLSVLPCHQAEASTMQKIMQWVNDRLDIYFYLRSADMSCLSMFVTHLEFTQRLMAGKEKLPPSAWNEISITPFGSDKVWWDYIKENNLYPNQNHEQLEYNTMLDHLAVIKNNNGLYFQSCLKNIYQLRLRCLNIHGLENQQPLHECTKEEEEKMLKFEITQAKYFNFLAENEREEILNPSKTSNDSE